AGRSRLAGCQPAFRGASARGRHTVSRVDRLADAVAERELDALLVTDLVNLRYVTGFTGTNGLAVVGAGPDGARIFVTDFRYVDRAADEVQGFEQRRGGRDLFDSVGEA